MTVNQIKDMINGHIRVAELRRENELQNGDDGVCSQVVAMSLRDVLNSIEAYEMDEY
jgi:hypothetical protein